MRRFLKMAWLDFKGKRSAFSLEEFLLLETLYPFFTMVFYCVLAMYSFNTTNLSHWVVGNSMLLCINTCIYSLGSSFTEERYYGRIRTIIASPSSKLLLIFQKSFFSCAVSIITVMIGFLLGCLCFGVKLNNISLCGLGLCFIIAMVSATGFGIFLASFGLMTDQMNFLLNTVGNLMMILCGANFPIIQLPVVVRYISYVFPLTACIKSSDMIFAGEEFIDYCPLLIFELFIGILYYILSYFMVEYAEKKAIKNATIDLF